MKYRIEWRYRWVWLKLDESCRWYDSSEPKWVGAGIAKNLKDYYKTPEEAIADLLLYLNDPYWADECDLNEFELQKFVVRIKNEISH